MFCDNNGKEIAGYRFGPYWFGVTLRGRGRRKGRISALCGQSYASEADLLRDYNETQQDCGLVRVYADGTETVLRASGFQQKPRQ